MDEAPGSKSAETPSEAAPVASTIIDALLRTEAVAERTAIVNDLADDDLLMRILERVRALDPALNERKESGTAQLVVVNDANVGLRMRLSDGELMEFRPLRFRIGTPGELDLIAHRFPSLVGSEKSATLPTGRPAWLVALIAADISGRQAEYDRFERLVDKWLRSPSVDTEVARRFVLVGPRQLCGFLDPNSATARKPEPVGPAAISTTVQAFAVPDQPIRSVADDRLNFRVYADAIAALVDNPQTETPLTLAINAPWGAGKSSLARLVDEKLRAKPAAGASEPHVTLWFDAWLHDEADKLQSAFLARLVRSLHARRILWRRHSMPLPGGLLSARERTIRRTLRWIGLTAVFAALSVAIWWIRPDLFATISALFGVTRAESATTALTGLVGPTLATLVVTLFGLASKVFETGKKVGEFISNPAAPANTGTLQRLRDELKSLIDEVLPPKAKLIVFIDDLERCRPPRGIELLEFCNQIFTEARVVLVLMTDMAALEANATLKYKDLNEFYRPSDASLSDRGTDSMFGRLFLQKMVQLQFNLPEQRHASALAAEPASTATAIPDGSASQIKRPTWVDPVEAAWSADTGAFAYLSRSTLVAMNKAPEWSSDPIRDALHRTRAPTWIVFPIMILVGIVILLPVLVGTASIMLLAWLIFLIARGCFDQSFPPSIRRFDRAGFAEFNRRRFYIAVSVAFAAAVAVGALFLTDISIDWLRDARPYLALAAFFVICWPIFMLLGLADDRVDKFKLLLNKLRENSIFEPPKQQDRVLTELITREREVLQRMNESDYFKMARDEALKHLRLRPRSVKRLINRIRLSVAILGEQGWLGGGAVPAEVLGRWAAFQELWPDLASSVVGRPALLGEIETFIDKNAPAPEAKFDRLEKRTRAGFERVVRSALPRFDEAEELFDFLVKARGIAPHLEALVYMQPRARAAAA
jgi:hypothetical protein